tara:strand:- start:158 stop:361 length:204 start_codon:yes stop_codon:yes gene_type:complete
VVELQPEVQEEVELTIHQEQRVMQGDIHQWRVMLEEQELLQVIFLEVVEEVLLKQVTQMGLDTVEMD